MIEGADFAGAAAEGSFDVAVSFQVIEHVTEREIGFAAGGELGPISRDRRLRIDEFAFDEQKEDDRGDRL